MNMGVYLFLLLFALMFSGMPIALGVGMAAILTTGIWGQIGLELIFQQYYQGVNSFALLAVPLFMLAGELMTRLGLVDDIILLAKLLVGRMRGSLAQINIVASVFFFHNVRLCGCRYCRYRRYAFAGHGKRGV